MQSLIVSLEAVLPLFIMMSVGYTVKSLKWITDGALVQVNGICFKVLLPVLLFVNIYNTDLNTAFNSKLLAFCLLGQLGLFILAFLVIYAVEKDDSRRGVLIQAIFRSNFIIFGIPVATSLYGAAAASVPAIIASALVPLSNVLSVIALETFSGKRFHVGRTLLEIIKNPLIIGAAAGLFFVFSGLRLPNVIMKVAGDMAATATPLSLLALGGSFYFSKARKNWRPLLAGVIGKLVASPLIMMPIALLLGFRGTELLVALIAFSAPTAVSTFTMAQQMNADSELAGEIVVFSAFCSIGTLFIFIFILRHLGFL